jgi:hypothetical protein
VTQLTQVHPSQKKTISGNQASGNLVIWGLGYASASISGNSMEDSSIKVIRSSGFDAYL